MLERKLPIEQDVEILGNWSTLLSSFIEENKNVLYHQSFVKKIHVFQKAFCDFENIIKHYEEPEPKAELPGNCVCSAAENVAHSMDPVKNAFELNKFPNFPSVDKAYDALVALRHTLIHVIKPGTIGLALSGGGVRSATFNLGVLQALNDGHKFKMVDYLSTVSGGGYIGSSLTYRMVNDDGEFPFAKQRKFNGSARKSRDLVDWLRTHASYLSPGYGLDRWALAAAVMRGIVINLIMVVPPAMLIMWLSSSGCKRLENGRLVCTDLIDRAVPDSVATAVLVIVVFLMFVGLRKLNDRESHRKVARIREIVVPVTVLCACSFFGALLMHEYSISSHWFILVPVLLICSIALSKGETQPSEFFGVNKLTFFETTAWVIVFGLLLTFFPGLPANGLADYPHIFVIVGLVGVAFLAKLLVSNVFYTILSANEWYRLEAGQHRYFSVQYGELLKWGVFFVSFGSLPLVYKTLLKMGSQITPLATIFSIFGAGALSTAIGWIKRTTSNEIQGYVAVLLRLGLGLLIMFGLLLAYHVGLDMHESRSIAELRIPLTILCLVPWILAILLGIIYVSIGWLLTLISAALLSETAAIFSDINYVYISWCAVWLSTVMLSDINYVSMHYYYRNRLLDAYLGFVSHNPDKKQARENDSDNLDFNKIDIGLTGAPYPIINTNLVTLGWQNPDSRRRDGESFIFSPKAAGSEQLSWATPRKGVNLATAMAISGAAVDPHTGDTKERAQNRLNKRQIKQYS